MMDDSDRTVALFFFSLSLWEQDSSFLLDMFATFAFHQQWWGIPLALKIIIVIGECS